METEVQKVPEVNDSVKIVQKTQQQQIQTRFAKIQKVFSILLVPILIFQTKKLVDSNQDCQGVKLHECATFTYQLVLQNISLYSIIGITFSIIWIFTIKQYVMNHVGVLSIALFIGIVFFYDNEITVTHYGGLITKLVGVITIFYLIVIVAIIIVYKIFRKRKAHTTLVLFIIIGLTYNSMKNSCQDWGQGSNGNQLIQSPKYCQVKEPKFCPYTLFERIIDLTPIMVGDCKNKISPDQLYLENMIKIDKNKKYIGFPDTTKFSQQHRKKDPDIGLQKTILSQALSFDTLDEALSDGRYIALDLNNKEYHYRIQRNKTLVGERLKNKIYNPYSQNVLIVFIDALSRGGLHRNLPQTMGLFEQRENTKRAKNLEFFRFYSLKPYTHPNYMRFTYEIASVYDKYIKFDFSNYTQFPCAPGVEFVQLIPEEQRDQHPNAQSSNFIDFSQYPPECEQKYRDFDNSAKYTLHSPPNNSFRIKQVSILDTVTKAGYVTARTSTDCEQNFGDHDIYSIYSDQTSDYEGLAYACDPNYYTINQYNLFQGPFSIVQRCLNGQSLTDHSLQFTVEFFQKYKSDPKYMMMEFMEGHEPSGSVISQVDEPMYQFFSQMEASGELDETLVVFFSDHGQHGHFFMGFFDSQQLFTERMMPALYISVPKSFNDQHPELVKILQNNNQKLFTMANLHFFLQTWLRGGDYKYQNQSLFQPDFPSNLNCEDAVNDFERTILEFSYQEICVCQAY